MSSFQLKALACVSMLIDHVGASLLYEFPVLRAIGRLAFPIYCFLLAEGFVRTRNRRKYMLRMLLFAFISEIPHDLALTGVIFSPDIQNVYFTLLLGLIAMEGFCVFKNRLPALGVLIPVAAAAAAELGKADYGAMGVAVMFFFYILRESKTLASLAFVLLNAVMTLMHGAYVQFLAALAVIPFMLYNGQRGRKVKWFFYCFYPAHLLAIFCAGEIYLRLSGAYL